MGDRHVLAVLPSYSSSTVIARLVIVLLAFAAPQVKRIATSLAVVRSTTLPVLVSCHVAAAAAPVCISTRPSASNPPLAPFVVQIRSASRFQPRTTLLAP